MFKLEFSTDNYAFSEDPGYESARILRDVAEDVEAGGLGGVIFDYNGNKVGTWKLNS